MKWEKPKSIQENQYDLPGSWLHIHYFEAINILFRVENALRVFVYIILKSQFNEKWKDLSITSDDEESSTIGAIAKRRLSQDKNYAYLGFVINSPLLHLTSGELIRIITSDSYWKYFKEYFLGSKEIIRTKLDEIGNVRNAVAHFRPIKEGDLDLVKQNALHTLSKIEDTIVEFINCTDIVPTNTSEEWYKELSVLGAETCNIKFSQSKDEEWIKLTIVFNSKILTKNIISKSIYIKAVNLKSNALLQEYPKLTNYIICATEKDSSKFMQNIDSLKFVKHLNLIFSKSVISNKYKFIKEELEKILFQISNEIELINQDNLARGKIIETVDFSLNGKNEQEFYCNGRMFNSTPRENDVPEYWGGLTFASKNFISDSEIFPWINVKISDDKSELPF